MDLKKFKRTTQRKKSKNTAFLKKLDEVVPVDMPSLVIRTDATVWRDVNCTACANCCKTMTPTFTPSDITRISRHFTLTTRQFKEKWLLKEQDTGDWVNKQQPCQFLVDDKCSIYEIRPRDCAEFPHHNKKPFDAYNDTFTNNIDKCPATFLLIDRMRQQIEKEYEW